jgi:hypothetical protein
MDAEKR